MYYPVIIMTHPLLWYPMRVTYNREMQMKSCFDALGIECFVPMKYVIEEEDYAVKEKLVPAIHNLIFVHSTQETITGLKMNNKDFAPLRYMMKHTGDSETQIMTVPDREMENFIQVTAMTDHSVIFLEDSDYLKKIGKTVRIKEGQFKDVVGVVKRIKRNRCVVIRIEGVAAVALTNVPSRFVEEI